MTCLVPYLIPPADQSPLTAAPSLQTGPTCKPASAFRPGSAIRRRHGRKVPWKTQIAALANGFREIPIRCRSSIATFTKCAPISTRRRASASALEHRPKCSGKSCWPPIAEAATLPRLPVAIRVELTRLYRDATHGQVRDATVASGPALDQPLTSGTKFSNATSLQPMPKDQQARRLGVARCHAFSHHHVRQGT